MAIFANIEIYKLLNDLPSDGCGNFLPRKINNNSFFYLVPPHPPVQEVHLCHVANVYRANSKRDAGRLG